MLILLFYLFLGFLVSLVMHICVFLNIAYPPKWLVTTLGIGINIVVLAVFLISRKIKKAIVKKELIRVLLDCCPYWLKIATGLVVMYGIVIFVSCFVWPFSELSTTRNENVVLHIAYEGLTALMLLFYGSFFTLLYCYRKLYKMYVCKDVSKLKAGNSTEEF
ncbi:MAG: hypothetical protein WC454_03965 [Phycisphaerae bacterium]